MTTLTKQRTKKAGGIRPETERHRASNGGAGGDATVANSAPTNTADVRDCELDSSLVGNGGGCGTVTDCSDAPIEQRGGDPTPETERECAATQSTAGHSRETVEGLGVLGGERNADSEAFGVAQNQQSDDAVRELDRIDVGPSGTVSEDRSATANGDADRCREIQELQRRRVFLLKMRIMIDNALSAGVSTAMGYRSGMEEADRKKLRAAADKLVKAIADGDELTPEQEAIAVNFSAIVASTRIARDGYNAELKAIEKAMAKLVKKLPVAEWIQAVRGFGLLNAAIIIGECGNLSNYANPAKVWKRLGLAPYQGQMPSTWRRKGGLSAEQWTEIGYSPRRRSAMFVLSECLVKLNDGEYRQRYDETKAKAAESHPDWPKGRCHYHGMLLAVKRLVRDFWAQWNKAS